jgi:hypothetical protein
MDALFHFAMSFAGGYVLLKGMKGGRHFGWGRLFLLSLLVGLIDLEHVMGHAPEIVFTHNLTFVLGAPLLLFLAFGWMKRSGRIGKEAGEGLQLYSLAAMVMLIGHMLADMIGGLYGIPLLFPFSTRLFLMPQSWNLFEIDHSYVVATAGIAVALYFGIVFLAVIAHDRYARKRKT